MKKKIFSIFLVMVLCIGMTAGCKKNVGTSQDNAIAEEDDCKHGAGYDADGGKSQESEG